MPEISRFFGIIIRMFYDDHAPPHFHVYYGSQQAFIDIETLSIIEGKLSSRAYRLVKEWALLHQEDLRKEWECVEKELPLFPIEPLE